MSLPARWIEADAYLFDIDGTLLNARGGAHYHAFHSALHEAFGIECHIDGVPLHGSTDIGILRAVADREGISPSEFSSRLASMLERMCTEVERNRGHVQAELCPSIAELVGLLHRNGKLLGVVSGNLERIGWIKLEAAGLRPFFSFGFFCDRAERRTDIFKNGIAEAQLRLGGTATVCIIGDTPADIKAARDNGASIIAVGTGIYSPYELGKESPDLCVSCCDELLPLLPQAE